jgi:hypothetical protein
MTEFESAAPRVPDSEGVNGGLKGNSCRLPARKGGVLLHVNYIGRYPQVA